MKKVSEKGNKNSKKYKKQNKKRSAHNYGKYAELLACIYLSLKGYRIVERRYKTKIGEIDLIAIKNKTVIFIEIKARKNKNIDEVLLKQQMTRITKAASLFIIKNKKFYNYSIRFDLVIVRSFIAFSHIKNAWGSDEYTHM